MITRAVKIPKFTRLSTIAPALVDLGARISDVQRKATARAVAQWACEKSGAILSLQKFLVNAMIDWGKIELGREEVLKLSQHFDESYFAISENNKIESEQPEADICFAKSRALESLVLASEADVLSNFYDALYEANAAINDLPGLIDLCKRNDEAH